MSWTPIGPAPALHDDTTWIIDFSHPDHPNHQVQVDVGYERLDNDERGEGYEVYQTIFRGERLNAGCVFAGEMAETTTIAIVHTEENAKALAKSHAEDWHRNGAQRITWDPNASA